METLHYLQRHLPPSALNIVRLAIWLVILAILFLPLERLWSLRKQKISRKNIFHDLIYYFLNSLLPAFILAFPISILAVAIHRIMPWPIVTFVAGMNIWVRFAAIVIVGEIGFYWGHRWSHEIPFLWRFHAVHHSAEEIDWLVNTRAHPLDMVFTRLCGLVPLYVLGLAQPTGSPADLAPVLLVLAGTFWGFFIHANVRWRLGWLGWLLSTPTFHHWHHTETDHRDRNYAAMLPVLDRVFGTYYVPKAEWPAKYGIAVPISPHLTGQLLDPLMPGKRS